MAKAEEIGSCFQVVVVVVEDCSLNRTEAR